MRTGLLTYDLNKQLVLHRSKKRKLSSFARASRVDGECDYTASEDNDKSASDSRYSSGNNTDGELLDKIRFTNIPRKRRSGLKSGPTLHSSAAEDDGFRSGFKDRYEAVNCSACGLSVPLADVRCCSCVTGLPEDNGEGDSDAEALAVEGMLNLTKLGGFRQPHSDEGTEIVPTDKDQHASPTRSQHKPCTSAKIKIEHVKDSSSTGASSQQNDSAPVVDRVHTLESQVKELQDALRQAEDDNKFHKQAFDKYAVLAKEMLTKCYSAEVDFNNLKAEQAQTKQELAQKTLEVDALKAELEAKSSEASAIQHRLVTDMRNQLHVKQEELNKSVREGMNYKLLLERLGFFIAALQQAKMCNLQELFSATQQQQQSCGQSSAAVLQRTTQTNQADKGMSKIPPQVLGAAAGNAARDLLEHSKGCSGDTASHQPYLQDASVCEPSLQLPVSRVESHSSQSSRLLHSMNGSLPSVATAVQGELFVPTGKGDMAIAFAARADVSKALQVSE